MSRGPKKEESPAGDRCETCRFWKEDFDPSATERSGECRQGPPAVLFDGEVGVFCAWAQTDHDAWCGAHRQREQ